ncbi:MAG: glycosyl transferase [Lachnospiraceae bacterium]|nr:glycosyl transferase [Lachnospiraceae bacterium]
MSIPRRIHYCWLSDDPVPEDMKRFVEGWKKLLPDYEFVKWDPERFAVDSSVWVSEAVDRKQYAFASDYIRLYAVYHYGGIYLDMDVEVLKPFDRLLDRPYMFAYETPDRKRIEAGCFGAEKNDPFLKACLDHYRDRHFVAGEGFSDTLPLSKVMSDIMRERDMDLSIYPWRYFTAKSYSTGMETPGSDTYAVHHFAGSWKSDKERRIVENARSIRNAHPVAGKLMAFVYEKTQKAVLMIKTGGIKELFFRTRQYMRR